MSIFCRTTRPKPPELVLPFCTTPVNLQGIPGEETSAQYWMDMGVAIVLYLGYFYYGLSTAPARMKAVCAEIKPGMTWSDLEAIRVAHGLTHPPHKETGSTLMAETRTMGRYSCKIDMEGGTVKAAKAQFLD